MYCLYVASLSNLVYSFGVGKAFSKVVFCVNSADLANPKKNYLIKDIEMASLVAAIEGVEFTLIEFSQSPKLILDDSDLVDIRLLERNSYMKKRRGIHLGLNPEYLSTFYPRIFPLRIRRLKLRAEMILRVLLPSGVREFYSIEGRENRFLCLRSKPINHKVVLERVKAWQEFLFSKDDSLRKQLEGRKVSFFLPLAPEYGGSQDFNRSSLKDFVSRLDLETTEVLVIKNHPRDAEKRSSYGLNFPKKLGVIYLEERHERCIPIEILLGLCESATIGGFFSTVMVGMREVFEVPPIIYLPKEGKVRAWYEYACVGLFESFSHLRVDI